MSSREEILGRLQRAAWVKPGQASGLVADKAPVPGDIEAFVARVQAAGAEVARVADVADARSVVGRVIMDAGASRVIGSVDRAVRELDLPGLAREMGFIYQESSAIKGTEYREYVTSCHLGITGCLCGLAETGSILLAHHHANERLVSHAPDHYVGVIFREQILDDRFSLAAVLKAEPSPPSAWTLVTGVSRTADVALQVVLGMHGPRRVTIVLIG